MAKAAYRAKKTIKAEDIKSFQPVKDKVNGKTFATIIILIACFTFAAFYPSLKADFVDWDDRGYIVDNQEVFTTLSFFDYFGKKVFMGNYHPLTMIIYDTLYTLFGLTPSVFHLLNLLLHIGNTCLIFLFIWKLSGNKLIITITVSVLFGIHPLHAESVTWVSELKDVLYTFFYLLSLLTYLKFKEKIKTYTISNYFKARYLIIIFLFLLSCLSKGMAVTLPVVLILIDYLKDKKITLHQITEKIPLLIISLIFGIVALRAQAASNAIIDLSDYSLFEKIIFPLYSAGFYIFKTFFPVNLSIFYPYPDSGNLPNYYFFASALTVGLIIAVIFSFKKNHKISFGILFYLFMIMPVSQIKPVGEAITAERYFYLSSIGIFYLLGLAFQYIYETDMPKTSKQALLLPVLPLLFFLFYVSFNRSKDWKNTISIWNAAINVNPDIDKAYYSIGFVYYEKGNYTNAEQYFKMALEKNPLNIKAYNNLGNCYYLKNSIDTALYYYQKTLEVDSEYAEGFYNIGNVFYLRSDYVQALWYYGKAIEKDPDNLLFIEQKSDCENQLKLK